MPAGLRLAHALIVDAAIATNSCAACLQSRRRGIRSARHSTRGTQMGPLTSGQPAWHRRRDGRDAVNERHGREPAAPASAEPAISTAPTVLSGVPGMLAMNGTLWPAGAGHARRLAGRAIGGQPPARRRSAYLFTGSMSTGPKGPEPAEKRHAGREPFRAGAAPFGGVRDSGFGSEGGLEGIEAYLSTMTVTTMMIRVCDTRTGCVRCTWMCESPAGLAGALSRALPIRDGGRF